jgi:putative protein-disulfide isomerase
MAEEAQTGNDKQQAIEEADQLEIIYYTDPLCCWSWAIEPQLRKLKFEFSGKLQWRICMGGLLSGWKNYHDEINSVTRPIQMGPVWMHAQQISGMPMNTILWIHDPPASSYPACIAVKCAALQSDRAGERYLRLLREALMLEGKNIAKENVLMEVAQQLSGEAAYNFDVSRFQFDWRNDNGLEAFRKDLQEVQYRNINRFPTMIIKAPGEGGLIVTGYRPYSELLKPIQQVAPGLQKTHDKINEEHYKNYWGSLTTREMKEISEVVI